VLNFIGLGGGPTLVGTLSTNFNSAKLQSALSATADQAAAYMKMPAADLKNLAPDVQAAIGSAAASGLRDALMWMTPFYAVAVFFLVLQTFAINREVKAGGPVRDGGFRLGIVLTLVGAVGLWFRYQAVGFPRALLDTKLLGEFGGAPIETQISTAMDAVTSVVTTIFLLWGVLLVVTGLFRKPATAAAAA